MAHPRHDLPNAPQSADIARLKWARFELSWTETQKLRGRG